MPVIAATQRPSVDIIPKSLRDLFGYRAAFRCTSTGSSDIILGDGWSGAGFSATDISPINPGEAFLIAEGGTPQRIKAAYLSDADIIALADYAAWTRRASPRHPRRPGHRRRLTTHPGKDTRSCHSPPTPPPARPSSPACAPWPTTSTSNPAVPVPRTARKSTCPPPAPTTAAAPRSRQFARQLGVAVPTDISYSGHYEAARHFGPVGYRMIAISDAAMARHRAADSYYGCVTPDTWT